MGEKIMDDKTIAPVHPETVGATIGAQLREFLELIDERRRRKTHDKSVSPFLVENQCQIFSYLFEKISRSLCVR
jgi:hypothetical protein